MKKKKNSLKSGEKPLYVIKIDEGYYCGKKAWQMVTLEEADKLTHKQAHAMRHYLKRPLP